MYIISKEALNAIILSNIIELYNGSLLQLNLQEKTCTGLHVSRRKKKLKNQLCSS